MNAPTTAPTQSSNAALNVWVEECARLCQPARVHWVDGSEAETRQLITEMLDSGTLHRLNADRFPNCYLHRSDPTDVARTEHLTFICSKTKEEAGPTNNWMEPAEAKRKVGALFEGAMTDPSCQG